MRRKIKENGLYHENKIPFKLEIVDANWMNVTGNGFSVIVQRLSRLGIIEDNLRQIQ